MNWDLLLDEDLFNAVILVFMVVVALAVAVHRSLIGAVMLMGIFSLLSALLFVALDAVDVAFTEAAVGAGVSVVLFLGAFALTKFQTTADLRRPITAGLICGLTGLFLIIGTLDMPYYGDPDAPIHTHVANFYILEGQDKTGVPNIVTAVLASFRGYDTLGETVVVFTAALGVLALLGRGRHPDRASPGPVEDEPAAPPAERAP